MLTPILSLLNRVNNTNIKKFNILTCPTHEGYQSMLDQTGHNFYMISGPNIKPWDFHTRPLPPNHFLHTNPINTIQPHIHYDLILCQNLVSQYPIFHEISHRFGIPIITLHHTEPPPGFTKTQFKQILQWKSQTTVYITNHNKQSWQDNGDGVVIPHGINSDIFSGWHGSETTGLSIVNQFPQRDVFCGWGLWQKITEKIQVKLVGENPGLSESINQVPKLVSEINRHRFFLNTSQLSPCPLSLLEAMSCGIPIVSTAKQEIPQIIQHGENGFLYDTPEEAIELCQELINNHDLAKKIGNAGRQTIVEKRSVKNFVNQWNEVFFGAYNEVRQ